MTRTVFLLGSLCCLMLAVDTLQAQVINYEAAAPDSFVTYGYHKIVGEQGDTILLDIYRSFAPIGDSTVPRRQALVAWAGVSAYAKVHHYRKAAVLYLWTEDSTDALREGNIAATWVMRFALDDQGCWHIVNDTTTISTCVARDDPGGAGAEHP